MLERTPPSGRSTSALASRWSAEQHPDLVAGQRGHHAAGARRGRHGEPVAVGVVGDHEVGVDLGGERQRASIAPGSSGLGKATVGKVPSGSAWEGTTWTSS
jgi:hypothetical protein